MTPEEKVEELIAARDEITAELLELMGTDVEVGEEEDEVPAPKKQRLCGVCRKPGHSVQSCPKNKPGNYGFKSDGKSGCLECGSKSRHRKSCSKAETKAKPTVPKKADDYEGTGSAMGPETYNNVKMLKSRDKRSKEISEQLDLNIREVNAAMGSSDYTHYLDIRESE